MAVLEYRFATDGRSCRPLRGGSRRGAMRPDSFPFLTVNIIPKAGRSVLLREDLPNRRVPASVKRRSFSFLTSRLVFFGSLTPYILRRTTVWDGRRVRTDDEGLRIASGNAERSSPPSFGISRCVAGFACAPLLRRGATEPPAGGGSAKAQSGGPSGVRRSATDIMLARTQIIGSVRVWRMERGF